MGYEFADLLQVESVIGTRWSWTTDEQGWVLGATSSIVARGFKLHEVVYFV